MTRYLTPNPEHFPLASSSHTGNLPAHAQGLQLERLPVSFLLGEGDPREPVHIHIRKGRDNAKFWLRPEVVLAYNRGFPPHVLTELVGVVEQNRELIECIWNDHFA